MSQLSSFGSGGGGGGIETINGNTGFVTGSTINIQTGQEQTLVFVGDDATNMALLTTDVNQNVSLGTDALEALTSATGNTMVGYQAGAADQDGPFNTGIGHQALNANVSGTGNVAIGRAALPNMTSGNFNTCIGYFAGVVLAGADSYNIIIGETTGASESGAIRIGDGGNNTTFFAGGIGGVNVGSTANVVTSSTTSTNGTQLGTAVITAGSGITITPGANTITIASTSSTILTFGSIGAFATAPNDIVYSINGGFTSSIAVAYVAGTPIPIAGTLSRLYVNAAANTSTTSVAVTIYVNAVATGITITIPSLTTGVFSDLVHTQALNAGDILSLKVQVPTTGGITGQASILFVS